MSATEPLLLANATTLANSSRIAMIDTAKGVGILLIVLGHNTLFGDHYPRLSDALMSFRLPFFFFISGVTLSIYRRSLWQIVVQRADAWLKPCAVVVIVMGVLKIARHTGTVENLLVGLSFGTGFTLAWTPLWFLPHLWLIYVTTSVLLMYGAFLCSTALRKAFLLIGCGWGGYMLQLLFDSSKQNDSCIKQLDFSMNLFRCGLPFSADLLPITIGFFLLGHFLATQVKSFTPHFIAGFSALAALVGSRIYWSYNLDLNSRVYENILVTPLEALCGIYVMLCICHLLSTSDYAARALGYLGRVSLFILIFHAPIQYILLRALPRWVHRDFLVAAASFGIAVCVSIALYYACKSNILLSRLMLPIKLRFKAIPVSI